MGIDGPHSLVEAGVMEEIDEAVKEKVAEELPRMMPKYLQDEVANHRKQLAEVQRALHNSYVGRLSSAEAGIHFAWSL